MRPPTRALVGSAHGRVKRGACDRLRRVQLRRIPPARRPRGSRHRAARAAVARARRLLRRPTRAAAWSWRRNPTRRAPVSRCWKPAATRSTPRSRRPSRWASASRSRRGSAAAPSSCCGSPTAPCSRSMRARRRRPRPTPRCTCGPGCRSAPRCSGRSRWRRPGCVAGLALVQERWGTLPLERVMQPAIRLAEQGFAIGPYHARMLEDLRANGLRGAARRDRAHPISAGWRARRARLAAAPARARAHAAADRGARTRRLLSRRDRGGDRRVPRAQRAASSRAPIWRPTPRSCARRCAAATAGSR